MRVVNYTCLPWKEEIFEVGTVEWDGLHNPENCYNILLALEGWFRFYNRNRGPFIGPHIGKVGTFVVKVGI